MLPLRHMKLTDLNVNITCKICCGYLIDATLIIECRHAFCKTCIVNYLQKSHFCPDCEVQVHKSKPLQSLREDKALQDVVYKLVPGLYRAERERRIVFYKEHPDAVGDRTEQALRESRHFFHGDDKISVSLEFLPPAHAHAHALGLRPLRAPSYDSKPDQSDVGGAEGDTDTEEPHQRGPHKRYFCLEAKAPVRVFAKIIRKKYQLSQHHKIDIVYNGDCLDLDMPILEILYAYKYAEDAPLRLQYTVISPPITSRKRLRIVSKKPLAVKESSEPSPKKLKLLSPIKEIKHSPVTAIPKLEPKNQEEEDCKSVELSTQLSNSLDSSRDDGDDAMVIDESGSDPAANEGEDKSPSPTKVTPSSPAVTTSVPISSQPLKVSTPPKPKYTLAASYDTSCSNSSITSSIESLKDFVNSSPSYPTCFPPNSSKDGEKGAPVKAPISREGSPMPQDASSVKAPENKAGVPPASSAESEAALPKDETQTSSAPVSTAEKKVPQFSVANNCADVKVSYNQSASGLITSVVSSKLANPPPVFTSEPSAKLAALAPAKDKQSSDKLLSGANNITHPNSTGSTSSLTKPNNVYSNTFATPVVPSLPSKTLSMPPPQPQTYRPHSMSLLKNGCPPPPPNGMDNRPRLGRPPNKLRKLASQMTPRMIPSVDMRSIVHPRPAGPRTGIYSQQRKPQVAADKTAELAKQQQAFAKAHAANSMNASQNGSQNPMPHRLLVPRMPQGQMSPLLSRETLQNMQSAPNGGTIVNQADPNLPTNPLFMGMNGFLASNAKKISPKDKLENNVNLPSGLSVTPLPGINRSSSADSNAPPHHLTNQSSANSRPNGSNAGPKGSMKSPGRTKANSNNNSIHSIAQNLVNKQMQQKSLASPNGLPATQPSLPPNTSAATTVAPMAVPTQNVLNGVLPTVPVDNPLASQFQAGLCMSPLNPLAAAAAYTYGNYNQAALQILSAKMRLSELIHNPALQQQQENQRKTEPSPMDLSPTNKTPPTSTLAAGNTAKSASSGQKYVPISPKTTAASKVPSVPLKIPNPAVKTHTSHINNNNNNNSSSTSKNPVSSAGSSALKSKSIAPVVSTVSRCTPVTSLASLQRNTSSPISASAPSPQSLRSPDLASVPSPKPAQSPSPTSPSTPATPTISPPTPEVTITKLPNATTASTTPPVPATVAPPSATTSVPASAPIKMPNANTVSITKRSSSSGTSSNKFGVARSPSNASVRHIPNPSFLSHQSEVKNHLATKVPVRNTT